MRRSIPCMVFAASICLIGQLSAQSYNQPYCPPGVVIPQPYCPPLQGSGEATPSTAPTPAPQQPEPQPQPQPQNNQPSDVGNQFDQFETGSLAQTSAFPNMLGDFFGNGAFVGAVPGLEDATLPIGGGDRRFKMTDNISPFPMDRVFFNYHHFHKAISNLTNQKGNLDRFTFGLEKTFLDDVASLEVRIPFAVGFDSQQNFTQQTMGDRESAAEFGNISLTPKVWLWGAGRANVSAGLGITLPTANDTELQFSTETPPVLVVKNQAVYLQPFVGFNYDCENGFFTQTYLAFDFEAGGNSVIQSGANVGDINSATLMYADWQLGYRIYTDLPDCPFDSVTPVIELHYTTSLDNGSAPSMSTARVFGDVDILNLTGGIQCDAGSTRLNFMGGVPLSQTSRVVGSSVKKSSFAAEIGFQLIQQF